MRRLMTRSPTRTARRTSCGCPRVPSWRARTSSARHRTTSARQPRPAFPPARLLELNDQAAEYFADAYRRSWASGYLADRLGTDLTGDDRFTPGYAPAGWTALTRHLQRHGATDAEILAAGLGRTASTGRVIDQFRDRLMFPIHGPDGQIHGFIGRRNPTHDADDATAVSAGPKYLNTAGTDLFDKGAQLFGLHEARAALAAGATPVLVEGPLDAIAVTLAAAGTHVGVAPLGTAFTDTQADQLLPYHRRRQTGGAGRHRRRPGRLDGRAPRLLAAHRPRRQPHPRPPPTDRTRRASSSTPDPPPYGNCWPKPSRWPAPSSTTTSPRCPTGCTPPKDTSPPPAPAPRSSAHCPLTGGSTHIDHLGNRLDAAPGAVHLAVIDAGTAWTDDPRGLAQQHIRSISNAARPRALAPAAPTTTRATDAVAGQPAPHADRPPADVGHAQDGGVPHPVRGEDRWRSVVDRIDPRLAQHDGWTALATTLDQAAEQGMDVESALPRLAVTGGPLPDRLAAQELRYRVIAASTIVPTNYDPQPERDQPRRTHREPPPASTPMPERPLGPRR